MVTFLPYHSFFESAKVLDYRRLGKQRVEAKQILNALFYPDYGWQRHPATKMWRGYEIALAHYGLTMCNEWTFRGFQDNTGKFFRDFLATNSEAKPEAPFWLGEPKLHRSHQSNLLRKDPHHYGKFGWDVHPHMRYFWPV